MVFGSQIINILVEASAGHGAKVVEEYCADICGRRNSSGLPLIAEVDSNKVERSIPAPNGVYTNGISLRRKTDSADDAETSASASNAVAGADSKVLSHCFGEFGGQYVSESLMDCLSELEEGFNKIKNDPAF